MGVIQGSFLNRSQSDPRVRHVLHELPGWFMQRLLELLESSGPLHIDGPDVQKRVVNQIFAKICQDFRVAASLFQQGYEVQGYTLVASMMESTYFMAYITSKPEQARAWLEHRELKWDQNFHTWLDGTLADMQRSGEITREQREELRLGAKQDYQLYCAYKHGNGYVLRQANIMKFPGDSLQVSVEPGYTLRSSAICAEGVTSALSIAYKAMQFYAFAMRLSPPKTLHAHMYQALEVAVAETGELILESLNPPADNSGS